jgi:hypothetical protein
MSELDRKISEKLAGINAEAAAPDMRVVLDAVMQEQRRLVRKARWWALGWHAFFLITLLIGVAMIFWNDRVNDIAAGLFVCTASLVGLVLIKLVYYQLRGRLRIELQLKQLELSVAEMKESIKDLKK